MKLQDLFKNLEFFILSFLPISLFIGDGFLNGYILIVDLIFLINFFNKKLFYYLKNILFYLLIIIWIYLIISALFVANSEISLIRALGFLRFIILVFAFKYFFKTYSNEQISKLLKIWFVIFIVVSFDIFFEFLTGQNLLGFKSDYSGRIASFTNDELKIGGFYYGFSLIVLTYIFLKFKNINHFYYLITLIFIIYISSIIGEKSNFIRLSLCLLIFFIITYPSNLIKKIFITSFIGLALFSIIYSNDMFKKRLVDEIIIPIKMVGIKNYINQTRYGSHFKIANNIIRDNLYFGIGVKKFRELSFETKYNKNKNMDGGSTHPHQIHLELLVELGLIGYILFLSFYLYSIIYGLRKFIYENNYFALSGSIFIFTTLLPLIPSGSFFTSYTATIFWINYSFIFFYNKKN